MMASESPKAQGKSIKRLTLTGSLLREGLGTCGRRQSPD